MAESVDALVSNTSGRKAVPVRPRLRVHLKTTKALNFNWLGALLFISLATYWQISVFCFSHTL